MSIIIRQGIKADLPQVMALIQELAEFEKEPHEVENSVAQLEEDGFGEQPVFEFFVAENEETKNILGLALYFYSYSTWKGKCIYLEDLIVTQSERGKGIGKRLLDRIIVKAKEANCYRVVWQVLDWNEPAIKFYKSLGADIPKEWLTCRLVKEQIDNYVPMDGE
ncbi:GNAT family N-acetyltransferase [Catalinimonas sp. 4WD22]|uniref:GNAT family N-acetyltransferase n=1 Tax=Catalinimonas locisalis TaxID=3133978 RepID=UPI00310165F2